ncbi:hypothetical protein BH11MYX4_BH11MYX4_06450 [soil metagenome]
MPKPYFVASTFDIHQSDAAWTQFKVNAYQLIVEMQAKLKPWELLGGLSSITDLPNSVLHLWRVDDPEDLVDGKRYFEESQLFDKMMDACDAPGAELLARMPYDPNFTAGGASTQSPSPDGRFYFLWVELTLRSGAGHRAKFVKACEGLLKRMGTDLQTWKLLAAGSTVSGRPNTVVHLWRLDSANELLEGMNWFGENNPDYVALASSCLRQRQQLFTSTIYNPLGQNGKLSPDDEKHKIKFHELMVRKGTNNG